MENPAQTVSAEWTDVPAMQLRFRWTATASVASAHKALRDPLVLQGQQVRQAQQAEQVRLVREANPAREVLLVRQVLQAHQVPTARQARKEAKVKMAVLAAKVSRDRRDPRANPEHQEEMASRERQARMASQATMDFGELRDRRRRMANPETLGLGERRDRLDPMRSIARARNELEGLSRRRRRHKLLCTGTERVDFLGLLGFIYVVFSRNVKRE